MQTRTQYTYGNKFSKAYDPAVPKFSGVLIKPLGHENRPNGLCVTVYPDKYFQGVKLMDKDYAVGVPRKNDYRVLKEMPAMEADALTQHGLDDMREVIIKNDPTGIQTKDVPDYEFLFEAIRELVGSLIGMVTPEKRSAQLKEIVHKADNFSMKQTNVEEGVQITFRA